MMRRVKMDPVVPLARPNISGLEEAAVLDVLRSDSLAMGPYAERFESAIAQAAGRAHGVACSSGTAGLHMAVIALGISEGDEVITSPFSFVASANCALYERARPVFVDIEEQTLGIDPDRVEMAWSSRTAAILPVHVFGNPCRISELENLARSRGVRLIEDACEALGSTVRGRPMGSFGDASVFAFYPNKQITTGEGGAVVTDDPDVAAVLRSLRNQGRDEDGTWLRHVRLGYNYRLDEMSAALGLAQLARADELRAGRRRVADLYEQALIDSDWVSTPRAAPEAEVDWFVYVVRLAAEIDRNRVIRHMHEQRVPTRPYFSPLHLQPLYRDRCGYKEGDFPVTEAVAASTLALPFSSLHGESDVSQTVAALRRAVDQSRKA